MEKFDYAAVALAIGAIVGLVMLPNPRTSHGRQQHLQSDTRTKVTGKNDAAEQAQLPEVVVVVHEEEGACGNSELLPGTAGELSERAQAARRAGGSSKLVFVINFALWVLLAMTFNAYSKAYLRATANPIGLVILQGAMGVVVLCSLGSLGVLELRSGAEFSKKLPTSRNVGLAALCHAFQALFTNFAVFVGGVAVTNALKAMEPVAAAAFSYFLLGKGITRDRGAALLVVMAGIWLLTSDGKGGDGGGGGNNRVLLSAAFTTAAVGTNALRNVAIKRGNPIPPHQTLLACSAAATMVGFGLALVRLVAKGMDAVLGQGCEGSPKDGRGGITWIEVEGVTAALCYVGFQLASFNLLAFLSPVGHAVGNCCKRVLVFGSGIGLLGEVMSLRQLGGTGLALVGVLVYSVAGVK